MYISVATLYKAICAYAEGEGHDAQQAAYKRKIAQQKALLDAAPVGAMMQTYAGATLLNTTLKPTKK